MQENDQFVTDGDQIQEVDATPLLSPGALNAMTKAEIDVQIATAKLYPRSLSRFSKEVLDMATLNQEVAAECMYVLPRDGKKIDGPSARLAEIVLSAWGNARGGARIVDESDKFIVAQGFVHDLERNVAISFEVRRRITSKNGKRYGDDMIGVTANAAASIAFRNAVFKVVPKAYWSPAYRQARNVVRGDAKTLADRRAAAIEAVKSLNVPLDRMLYALGVEGIEDIGLDELVTLRGMLNAIEEGDTTVDQAFPDPVRKAEPRPGSESPGMAGLKVSVGADPVKAVPGEASPYQRPEPPAPAMPPPAAEAPAHAAPHAAPAAEYPTLKRLGLIPPPKEELDLVTQARVKASEVASEGPGDFQAKMKEVEDLVSSARAEFRKMRAAKSQ